MSPGKPVTLRTRRGTIVVVVAAALALPSGSWVLSARVNHNTETSGDLCMSVHRIVHAGELILDTKRSLDDALKRGLITQEAYDAALRQSEPFRALREENLRIWRSADCRPSDLSQ